MISLFPSSVNQCYLINKRTCSAHISHHSQYLYEIEIIHPHRNLQDYLFALWCAISSNFNHVYLRIYHNNGYLTTQWRLTSFFLTIRFSDQLNSFLSCSHWSLPNCFDIVYSVEMPMLLASSIGVYIDDANYSIYVFLLARRRVRVCVRRGRGLIKLIECHTSF